MNDSTTADAYDPYTLPPKTHNQAPANGPFDAIRQEIEDLFDTAKDFCDGEPIADEAMADTITKLHDSLHEAGKRAEEMRVAEKKPHDDAAAAVQAKYNPLVQPKKGKVALGKEACASLLAPWRKKIADEKAAIAAREREEADRKTAEAQAAIRASAGNLAEREAAEELLKEAKAGERTAKRAEKAATTGTGLRSVWKTDIADTEAALEWAYGYAPGEFTALALSLAEERVRAGVRTLPGFVIREEKVAR